MEAYRSFLLTGVRFRWSSGGSALFSPSTTSIKSDRKPMSSYQIKQKQARKATIAQLSNIPYLFQPPHPKHLQQKTQRISRNPFTVHDSGHAFGCRLWTRAYKQQADGGKFNVTRLSHEPHKSLQVF